MSTAQPVRHVQAVFLYVPDMQETLTRIIKYTAISGLTYTKICDIINIAAYLNV